MDARDGGSDGADVRRHRLRLRDNARASVHELAPPTQVVRGQGSRRHRQAAVAQAGQAGQGRQGRDVPHGGHRRREGRELATVAATRPRPRRYALPD